ncbi:Hypothetical protein, putative [Bodo saltans]|uniref:Uncharacterized protein n=1 Tax=Bodo saltans TaxID=75058 RepID=A0A0S4IK56_BODSA|nr:Hypothetical protein, putative [Bodo saltans]|eukprot:CUE61059.1 Hypothetical protein, putative [Bodo saltans]
MLLAISLCCTSTSIGLQTPFLTLKTSILPSFHPFQFKTTKQPTATLTHTSPT